jgi:hypothetical protein
MSDTTGWWNCGGSREKRIGTHMFEIRKNEHGTWSLAVRLHGQIVWLATRDKLSQCQSLAHATARLWEATS